ncbi:monothiol glutaredoxin-S7, chloroplastic isoform X2 [Hevea brasiliensis]|uniref:monothiol glutaredoxin-S7, chloroplastic isoform X2 n=1 Tax=Hevea brasiliensis TaxID=3981 RepID=UPI0025EE7EEE|nr:monothiol glutaredoxin-S7, chloroplastic isoform X2 [Hevea brasiliensis]
MATQSVFSSSPRIAPPHSSSPIKITSAAPPLLNSGSRSLSFPLRSTVPGKLAFRVSSTPSRIASICCALSPDLKNTLDKVVTSQKVVLFMKGTKDFPQCGFSNTVVQVLNSLNVPYETINILENEVLRQGLKEYSNWPTFPQLYIDGEFYGGCDITVVYAGKNRYEAYKSGELQELLERAMCS